MTLAAARSRYSALVFVALGLACGDAATAPPAGVDEALLVSLVGIDADDRGIVLRLTGMVDHIEATRASLDLAWAPHETNATTVALVGPLSEMGDLFLVRRPADREPLRVEVLELARVDGTISLQPSSARATVRPANGR